MERTLRTAKAVAHDDGTQTASHRYLGNALVLPPGPPYQQETQQGVALLADVPQSLALGTGVFLGIIPT
jgi:hypothetical protein